MSQRLSFWTRFWTTFRYDAKKARENYDSARPADPQMWQFWTGAAIFAVVSGLKIIVPWNLPCDFPPTEEEYNAYYAGRRVEAQKSYTHPAS